MSMHSNANDWIVRDEFFCGATRMYVDRCYCRLSGLFVGLKVAHCSVVGGGDGKGGGIVVGCVGGVVCEV